MLMIRSDVQAILLNPMQRNAKNLLRAKRGAFDYE